MPARRRRFESWGSTPPPSRTAGPRGGSLGAPRGSSPSGDHPIFLDANVLFSAAYRVMRVLGGFDCSLKRGS